MQETIVDPQVPSQAQFDSWIGSLPKPVAEVVRAPTYAEVPPA